MEDPNQSHPSTVETGVEDIQLQQPNSGQQSPLQGPQSGAIAAQAQVANSGKLFVGQVPAVCTEEMLTPLFQPYGTILEVKIMRDHQGRSKGCAWVRYETQAMAQSAIDALHEKHAIPPQTNSLRVQFAFQSRPHGQRPQGNVYGGYGGHHAHHQHQSYHHNHHRHSYMHGQGGGNFNQHNNFAGRNAMNGGNVMHGGGNGYGAHFGAQQGGNAFIGHHHHHHHQYTAAHQQQSRGGMQIPQHQQQQVQQQQPQNHSAYQFQSIPQQMGGHPQQQVISQYGHQYQQHGAAAPPFSSGQHVAMLPSHQQGQAQGQWQQQMIAQQQGQQGAGHNGPNVW